MVGGLWSVAGRWAVVLYYAVYGVEDAKRTSNKLNE